MLVRHLERAKDNRDFSVSQLVSLFLRRLTPLCNPDPFRTEELFADANAIVETGANKPLLQVQPRPVAQPAQQLA